MPNTLVLIVAASGLAAIPLVEKPVDPWYLANAGKLLPTLQARKNADALLLISARDFARELVKLRKDPSGENEWKRLHTALKKYRAGIRKKTPTVHLRVFYERGVHSKLLADQLDKKIESELKDVGLEIVCNDCHWRNDDVSWQKFRLMLEKLGPPFRVHGGVI